MYNKTIISKVSRHQQNNSILYKHFGINFNLTEVFCQVLKSSIKPPPPPPRDLLNKIDPGAYLRWGSYFFLAKTLVSVLPKELVYKVENHKYEKLEIMQPCQLVNNPSWISPHQLLQSWLIDTVKWRIIRGRLGGLLTFFHWKGGGLLERGGLKGQVYGSVHAH